MIFLAVAGKMSIFPDLENAAVHSNIYTSSKVATEFFWHDLHNLKLECTSRKDPKKCTKTKVVSSLTSLVPNVSGLAEAVEVAGRLRQTKITKRIAKKIRFESRTDRDKVLVVAKAFVKLNIAFYDILYSGKVVAISEDSLCNIASDMVHRIFHYIKHSDGTQVLTENFIITATLEGKSKERPNRLMTILKPVKYGVVDSVDGSSIYLSKLLETKRLREYDAKVHHPPIYRVPFPFEEDPSKDVLEFWDASDALIDVIAEEIVDSILRGVHSIQMIRDWISLSFSSTNNSVSPSPRGSWDARSTFEFNIGRHNPYFIGRQKELSILKEKIVWEGSGGNVLVLGGCGGVGKSELVRYFIHLNLKELGCNAIWLQANNENNFFNCLSSLAHALEILVPRVDALCSVVEFFNILTDKLKREARNTLFVFDEAEVEELPVVKELFVELSKESGHFILITSRTRWILCNSMEIGGLEEDESISMVEQVLGSVFEEAEILGVSQDTLEYAGRTLSSHFQNHPLALWQSLCYFQLQNELEQGTLCSLLNDLPNRLKDRGLESEILNFKLNLLKSNYYSSVAENWGKIFRHLNATNDLLTLKFLKTAALLSVILQLREEQTPTKFIHLVLLFDEKTMKAVSGVLWRFHLVKSVNYQFISIPKVYLRAIYASMNEYDEVGVLGWCLQFYQTQCNNNSMFSPTYASYSVQILKYVEKFPELKGLCAQVLPILLRTIRSYEIHADLVNSYYGRCKRNANIRNSNSKSSVDSVLACGLKLEMIYLKFLKEDCSSSSSCSCSVLILEVEEIIQELDECMSLEKREDSGIILSGSHVDTVHQYFCSNILLLKLQAYMDLAAIHKRSGDSKRTAEAVDVVLEYLEGDCATTSLDHWNTIKAQANHFKLLLELELKE